MKLVVVIYYGEDTALVNIRWLMTSQIGSTENIIYNLHIYKIDFNIDKGKNDYENSVRKMVFVFPRQIKMKLSPKVTELFWPDSRAVRISVVTPGKIVRLSIL